MDWYYWLFPPIMMAAPLGMVWWAERTLPPAPDVAWRRWGKVLLPVVALLVIAVYLAAYGVYGRVAWVTHGLSYLYFPIWGVAMALTIRPDSNFGERNTNRVERSASLKPRHRESPVPPGWWTFAWLLAGGGAAVLTAAAFVLKASGLTLFAALVFAAGAVFSVGLTHWTLPLTLMEPEPLDPSGDPGIQERYTRFRRGRARMLFGLFGVVMPILVLGTGAGALWATGSAVAGATMGVVGGVLGSAFGIAGALIGIQADMKRKELRDAVQSTDRRAAGAGDDGLAVSP